MNYEEHPPNCRCDACLLFAAWKCGQSHAPERRPHRCPLCMGNGYSSSLSNSTAGVCHGCKGTGIVWEPTT